MSRYATGDGAAFAIVYEELSPRLLRYLRRLMRSDSLAEDALQQAFLQIHLSRGRFHTGARVEPWAYAIAHAVAVDALRKEQRRRTDELKDDVRADPGPGAESFVAATEISEALRNELQGVSEKLREAFMLVRLEGFSHAEAAEVLGIEETATKVRAHRASVWLRDKLSRFRAREGS